MGPGRVGAEGIRIAGVLVLCAALAGCNAFRPGREDTLRIGLTPDYPPIVYREGDALLGVEPELGRMAADALGRQPEFVELAWEDLVPSLERGEIDVIMSGMSITPERAERVLFTEPYMRVGQVSVIRRAELARLGAPAAIRRPGARVGYVAGTTGEDLVRTGLALAESYAFDDVAAALRSLRAGRIDFFVHDAPTIWRVTMAPGGDELVGLFRPLTDERLAWAVARNAPGLKRRLDAILDDWRAANRIEPVLNRWIPVRVEVGD
jgi:polar amino acid transport system substrate-binding protein